MERAVPILPADDLIAAKTFYVDGLGFQVTFEVPHLLGLQRGTIELTLDTQTEGHGRNACVSLHVDDVDTYYQEWSPKVPVLRAPKNEDWGAEPSTSWTPPATPSSSWDPSANPSSPALSIKRKDIIPSWLR